MSEEKVLYKFKRNPTEEVRACIKEFKKKANIDIRIYYMDNEGEWKPTKKGIYLSPEYLPELKEAVAAIEEELNKMEAEE